MTKAKATKATKPAEQYILASGSHSQRVGGIVRKFEAGDLISPSELELAAFPMKFISLAEYAALIEGDRLQRQARRALEKKMLPPRVSKLGKRDSESIKRGKKLLKMKRSTQRRILIS